MLDKINIEYIQNTEYYLTSNIIILLQIYRNRCSTVLTECAQTKTII